MVEVWLDHFHEISLYFHHHFRTLFSILDPKQNELLTHVLRQTVINKSLKYVSKLRNCGYVILVHLKTVDM